jgi:WD40 repeat protein
MTRPFRFSADGRTLIAVADQKVKRWEVETGRELSSTSLSNAKHFYFAYLSDDGRIFAALSMGNAAVKIWETATGREVRSLTFDSGEITIGNEVIALSPDGQFLAAFTQTSTGSLRKIEYKLQITLWETATGRKAQTLKVQSNAFTVMGEAKPATLAFSPDGSWLVLRDTESLKTWETATGREVSNNASARSSNSSDPGIAFLESRFAFSPDRKLVSIISETDKVKLLDPASAATRHTLAGHKGNVAAISFSTDGKLIASSALDGQIKIWETATGAELRTLKGSAMPINDVVFSGDGRSLTLGGRQATSLWELATGGVRRGFTLPEDYGRATWSSMVSNSSMLSPDGRLLISGSSSEAIAKI